MSRGRYLHTANLGSPNIIKAMNAKTIEIKPALNIQLRQEIPGPLLCPYHMQFIVLFCFVSSYFFKGVICVLSTKAFN